MIFDNKNDEGMYRKIAGLAMFQQMRNKHNQPLFNNVEQDFIWTVRQVFVNEYKDCDFQFKADKDHMISFKVDHILVGKVTLRENRKMLLNVDTNMWYDIFDRETYFNAKKMIVQWLEYFKLKQ